jgi:hypothetical protein
VTGDQFRAVPAEDRLGRIVGEARAVTAQVRAMPALAGARRSTIRRAADDLLEASVALSVAVDEAAHRAPAAEDL